MQRTSLLLTLVCGWVFFYIRIIFFLNYFKLSYTDAKHLSVFHVSFINLHRNNTFSSIFQFDDWPYSICAPQPPWIRSWDRWVFLASYTLGNFQSLFFMTLPYLNMATPLILTRTFLDLCLSYVSSWLDWGYAF